VTRRVIPGFAGLLLLTELLLGLGFLWGGPLVFDVGPSTGAYGTGLTESEERPPSTFRWTESAARITLPLRLAGGEPRLSLRCARFLDQPGRMHVAVAGRAAGTFTAPPGGYRVHRLTPGPVRGPVRVDLLSDDPKLGVALDWVRIEGARWRLPVAVWGPRVLPLALCATALLAGWALRHALGLGVAVGLLQAVWAARDPFGFTHVASSIAWTLPALSTGAALVLRRFPRGRIVLVLFWVSYLLKAGALFHPSYFYNDVRNNFRYTAALRDDGRPLRERNHAAQVAVGVAYPRMVAGRKYAFPYSPVFFLPFTRLPDPEVVPAIKHVAVAAGAAEVVLAFVMAGLVFGPGAGVAAAGLDAVLPPLHSRMMLAMWSTTAGHFVDVAVVVLVLALAARGPTPGRLLALGASLPLALLTYIASLFNLGAFSAAYSLLAPRGWRLLAAYVAGVAVTVMVLYRDFVVTLLWEILPSLTAAGGGVGASGVERPGLGEGLLTALWRLPFFLGYGVLALALAGLVLARRRAAPAVFQVVAAYALAFAFLVALRGLSFGLFKDLKEIEFATPLLAVLAGASLEALWDRDSAGRGAAVLLALGILVFVLSRYREYWLTWTFLAGLG
jgi:hypothetical protein